MKGSERAARLSKTEFKRVIRSPGVIVSSLLMVVVGAIVAWAFNADSQQHNVFRVFMSGAGAQALMRQGLESVAARREPRAGSNDFWTWSE